MPMRAHAIANRKQVGLAVHVERQMLHDARRYRRGRPRRMGDALDALNFTDLWTLHEGKESFVHAVHPVERRQVHPDDLRVELDLALDVLGANREMMNSIWQTHR